ncbi:hypothetical protein GGR42_001628 [Saonia flava]|uniref:Class I SAM-dependent methyltransferase n=1 Tax=Saonia flava TaxID=523696 RepID=A0A846QQ46_9FLAO|nr:class I SAM-dependent methyltransferase [Saonia flava]NJB71166.1 hypothetical protein [Saonia flava]
MKRIQLFEFEDYDWFPTWLRTCMTNLINVLHKLLGVSDVLANLVAQALIKSNAKQIVDLGSGAGGAMPEVMKILHGYDRYKDVNLIMTDLYPDDEMVAKFNSQYNPSIKYHKSPVDATDIANTPEGLKTMVNSFHHMNPENAKEILKSAQENKQPLLIYEMGQNNIPLLMWWLLLPISLAVMMLMVLFMTPFVKPLTWRQLVFTYLIPIIPICYAWDGQASLPRMYTLKDMDVLLEGLETENYTWEKAIMYRKKGKKLGTYVMGLPK